MKKYLDKKLFISVLIVLLIGGGYFFLVNELREKPPEIPRISSALLQGKLSKDGGAVLMKGVDKKYKKGNGVALKGGSVNLGVVEGAGNLYDVIKNVKPLKGDTKVIYMFWNPLEQKWVTTPQKVYAGTRTVKEANLNKEKIIGGGVVLTDDDVEVLNFNNGSFPGKKANLCDDLVPGWQLKVLNNQGYSQSYSGCQNQIEAIWEKAADGSNNFVSVPFSKIDNWNVKNYVHWVKVMGAEVSNKEEENYKKAVYEIWCDEFNGKDGAKNSEKTYVKYGFKDGFSDKKLWAISKKLDKETKKIIETAKKDCSVNKKFTEKEKSNYLAATYEAHCGFYKANSLNIDLDKIIKKHNIDEDDILELEEAIGAKKTKEAVDKAYKDCSDGTKDDKELYQFLTEGIDVTVEF